MRFSRRHHFSLLEISSTTAVLVVFPKSLGYSLHHRLCCARCVFRRFIKWEPNASPSPNNRVSIQSSNEGRHVVDVVNSKTDVMSVCSNGGRFVFYVEELCCEL